MALDIVGGIRAMALADATLVALLATYGSAPAIFGGRQLPEDFAETLEPKPCVVIDEPLRDEDDSDLTNVARDVDVRVFFYSKPSNGTTIDMLNAVERFKTIFRNSRQEAFSTGKLQACFVAGPQYSPTEDPSTEGRFFSLRLLIKEN